VTPGELSGKTGIIIPGIYELAQDLMSAPASQAYVGRLFSLCGFLAGVAGLTFIAFVSAANPVHDGLLKYLRQILGPRGQPNKGS